MAIIFINKYLHNQVEIKPYESWQGTSQPAKTWSYAEVFSNNKTFQKTEILPHTHIFG